MMNKVSELRIKNMVCDRCIKVVREIFRQSNIPVKNIELGYIQFEEDQELDLKKVSKQLESEGFALIDDKTTKAISDIKTAVIKQIHHHSAGDSFTNLTDYLEKEIGKSYSTLSTIFSTNEGRTIEKFSIQQRIERVKELLIYDEKTVSEIAFELGYSSAQYLSNQFKTETGFTPSEFKKLISSHRKPLDEI